LAAQAIVSDAHQLTNVTTAKIASSCKEVLVTLPVPLVLLLTKRPSSVFLVTPRARLVSIIPVHVPAASLEMVSCRLLVSIRSVSRNVLKVLSPWMVSVKSATSDVPSVSVPLETVLPAPLEDIFTTLLVGTTAQESSMPMEDVLTNAHPVTSDNPIKSASRAQLNARLAAATQLA
jgi:hypothetical protein